MDKAVADCLKLVEDKLYEEVLESELEEEEEKLNCFFSKQQKQNTYQKSKRGKQRKIKKVSYVWYIGKVKDTKGKVLYIQPLKLSKTRKFAKKQTNKRIRQRKYDYLLEGANYRKVYDYWWTVF